MVLWIYLMLSYWYFVLNASIALYCVCCTCFYLVLVVLVWMIITLCFDHCSHSLYDCLVFDQVAFMHTIHIILDRIVLVTFSCLYTCFKL